MGSIQQHLLDTTEAPSWPCHSLEEEKRRRREEKQAVIKCKEDYVSGVQGHFVYSLVLVFIQCGVLLVNVIYNFKTDFSVRDTLFECKVSD